MEFDLVKFFILKIKFLKIGFYLLTTLTKIDFKFPTLYKKIDYVQFK